MSLVTLDELGPSEIKHLPHHYLVAQGKKLSVGVPSERILEGMHLNKFCPNIATLMFIDVRETVGDRTSRDRSDQSASRKHSLTNRDIHIWMRVKDSEIKQHENDAISVSTIVAELKEEPFDPILIFKPQSIKDSTYPTHGVFSASFPDTILKWNCIVNMPQLSDSTHAWDQPVLILNCPR